MQWAIEFNSVLFQDRVLEANSSEQGITNENMEIKSRLSQDYNIGGILYS